MALCEYKPETFDKLRQYKSFNYLTNDKYYRDGVETDEKSDLWKFSNFVELLSDEAGL
jgi:hypothetical protein